MAIPVASSSSSFSFNSGTRYRYDAFLSFRGEDTRHSFTEILYDALRRKGINAFIDDKRLGKGEEISPTLLKAIERSRISIIVFSTNYATSTWCLEELAHIVWCRKQKKQVVMPIFYKVDPLDVQYQRNSFEEAMAALEDRFSDDLEKVRKWRSALSEAASLSPAWLFQDGYDQFGFIENIVQGAFVTLPPKRFQNTDYTVGLEPHIEEVVSLLDKSDHRVCMLGIHGTGGIGKTTLAKAIYNSIFYKFEGSCFLFDIREESNKFQGIVRLQQTLLSEILEEKRMTFSSVYEGISRIKHRLSHKQVLLVLDDVDHDEQLEQLAGGCDWFGNGSKVIITTRNKQLLISHNIEQTYEMKELNKHASLELFCWHAFHESQPPKGYQDMSNCVVTYVQGLPLALRLIGSNLAHKSLEEWRTTLKRYDLIPKKTIHEVLKISYDCLQDDAKRIFLDIACFFKKEKLEFIEEILQACDYGARFYIEVLVEKSLITINDENGRLYMHDLIQQMGREIVRREAPSDIGKRSRLWYYKDVLKALCENLGSNKIEGMMLDPPQQQGVEWSGLAFEKMNNLKILIVRNAQFSTSPRYFPNSLRLLDWEGYPSMTLPPDFSPAKLVCFKLYRSLFSLEEPFKFEHVTHMDFSHCEFIAEVPDMSQFQSLRRLLFQGCRNLIKVHDSVGSLSRLVRLDVSECTKLTIFPHEINMPSLQELNLRECKSLDYFPNILGKMDSLTDIFASETAIIELPPSIGYLPALESLFIRSCKSLRELPNSLLMLQNLSTLDLGDIQPHGRKSLKRLMQESRPAISYTNLEYLDLENCGLLDEDLCLTLNCFQNVQELNLSRNDFVSLPECIKECANLIKLDVTNCKRLRDIPELPSKLKDIRAENCTSLTMESLGHLWSQVKNCFCLGIGSPATTFPDWFDHCCKGGILSFGVHGKIFPRVVIAIKSWKSNTRKRHFFQVFMRINGRKMPWIQSDAADASEEGRVFVFFGKPGHVFLFDLLKDFREEELERLNKFLKLDWNDVEIQVTCLPHDIAVVKCGIYVDKQQTNMENVQFKSPVISRTSLKRRAIASPPNKPPKKLLRKFKATDERKLNNTKKGTRRSKPLQNFHSWYKKKVFFLMGKHLWRFLYY
ncbi:disease resistance protein RUN1-like isoform X2 [Prosopis cineraria]|uniref:disease resistance protein RUN1-like isoform X2 n=1 Tax=Prosopis cineraria TaxID=364024 RepID=UPI00240EDCB5|nr:disease resistance protein RUN1-like isoform X2 [Prosopis cineraria]XP_054791329.1 disease resistance protein RUN1-like isoform X2 [Prosopis cineraria]